MAYCAPSVCYTSARAVLGEKGRHCTSLDPLIQAGFVIFARNGMMQVARVRETQLSGALVNVKRDMCGVWDMTMQQLSQPLPTELSLGYCVPAN